MLIPPHPDPNDSGIDSDDTEALVAQARLLGGRASDTSSSDGDNLEKAWWHAHAMKNSNDDDQNLLLWSQDENQERRCSVGASSPERASPPLYEVELTASDEDDDGSVLELVIPMQVARYQRVPTSSSKKDNKKPTSFFWSVFCCSRK